MDRIEAAIKLVTSVSFGTHGTVQYLANGELLNAAKAFLLNELAINDCAPPSAALLDNAEDFPVTAAELAGLTRRAESHPRETWSRLLELTKRLEDWEKARGQ